MSFNYITMVLRKDRKEAKMKIVLVVSIIIVGIYLGYKKLNITSKKKEMSVKIEKADDTSHYSHWEAMYGFTDETDQKIDESLSELKLEEVLNENLALYRTSYGKIEHIALVEEEGIVTLFPKLLTQKHIPVTLKSIVEWTDSNGQEAHITGNGRDAFGLGFFATDYAQNSELYKKGGTLNIALSAFAYVVEKSSIAEKNVSEELAFSEDFAGYIPSQQLDSGYDFEFIGKVLSVETINYRDEKFYMMEVKLINADELEFVLPMAVNLKCVRDNKVIEVGENITGAFWLQGRIL